MVLQRPYPTRDATEGEGRMSSSSRPPRSRYHFGFRGKRPGRNRKAATTDEILESLTRQAKLIEKDGEERTLGLQTILDNERTEELPQDPRLEQPSRFEHPRSLNFGRYAFTAMLVGGLIFLWIYARLSQTLSLQSLATLQQTISRVGFADSQKLALIAISAFTIAVIAHHSRNKASSRLA